MILYYAGNSGGSDGWFLPENLLSKVSLLFSYSEMIDPRGNQARKWGRFRMAVRDRRRSGRRPNK